MSSRPLLRAALGAWLAATLVATFAPFWPLRDSPLPFAAHSRLGAWDFPLNILLFAPAGALLSLLGRPASLAVGLCALLSLAIESAQMHLPHRHPSHLDIAANTLGALAGAACAAWVARRWPSLRTS